MPKVIEGQMSSKGLKLAIVVSRFNDFISSRLVEGAMDIVTRSGGDDDSTVVIKVPGAFEIPLMAKRVAASGKYDAVICLGAVIKGATHHFDHVATQMSRGLSQTMLETGVPISFGVITADDLEQAIERAGSKQGNKGAQAAMAAIEMANVIKEIL